MNRNFFKSALVTAAAVSAVCAVSVREDYFPLAVGNSWTFETQDDLIVIDDPQVETPVYPLKTSWSVLSKSDSTYQIVEITYNELTVFTPIYYEVTSKDNGMIQGFRGESGIYRHTYYPDDFGFVDTNLVPFYSMDNLYSTGYRTHYRDVWAVDLVGPISNYNSNTTVFDGGIGPVGFGMTAYLQEPIADKKESSFDVVMGKKLTSAELIETPRVVDANSAILLVPSDSTFDVKEENCLSYHPNMEKWTEECVTGIQISYPFPYALTDAHLVTSSYSEINNTLRIWIADTAAEPMDCMPEMDCISQPPEPRGGFLHTLNIDRVMDKKSIQVKVFYEETKYQGSSRTPDLIYNEEVIVDGSVDISDLAYSPKQQSLFSISNNTITLHNLNSGIATVTINDVRGRVIKQSNLTGSVSLPLKELSKGVYLISVKSGNMVQTKKITLQ